MDEKDTQQRIKELENRLSLLERADNVNSLKYWREKMIGRDFGANDNAVDIVNNISVDLMTGLGTLTTVDFPDGFIDVIKPNGDRVRVPYYSLSRF